MRQRDGRVGTAEIDFDIVIWMEGQMDSTLNNRSQPVILSKDFTTPEMDPISSEAQPPIHPPRGETDRSGELGSDMTKLEALTPLVTTRLHPSGLHPPSGGGRGSADNINTWGQTPIPIGDERIGTPRYGGWSPVDI